MIIIFVIVNIAHHILTVNLYFHNLQIFHNYILSCRRIISYVFSHSTGSCKCSRTIRTLLSIYSPMISHINMLRRQEGEDLKQAVIDGTRHRFRPVLMTATVAVLGLLPASLSTGIGSDVQRPLATVIVYGLLFATVITLYALPVLYYLVERRHLARKKPEPEEV